jgi:hypothetical protein
MGGDGNGDRLNRQIKATEAYANLRNDIGELRRDLLGGGEAHVEGALPRILTSLERLEGNPMVRFGLALRTTRRVVIALAAFGAACAAIATVTVDVIARIRQGG